MKIIHLIKGSEWGGVARYVLDFCAAMDSSGHEVTLLSGATDSIDDNFRSCGLHVAKAPLKKFGDWRSLSVLSKTIDRGEPSIIHVHGFLDAFPAVIARLLFGCRKTAIVVTRHIVKPGSHSLFNRWIYGSVDKVVFVSQLAMDTFLSSNPPIDCGKLSVVHNSVKVDTAVKRVEPEPTSDGHRLKLLFVGRVCRDKGIEVLLDALKLLKDENLTLDVVGTGDDSYVEQLKQIAEDSGISGRVHWLGFHEDVHPFIESADVVVCPSIVREACPLSVLECMAHGKAVIASDNGGQAEFVASGRNGVLVPSGDPEGLAEAIRGIIASLELRQRLGLNALSDFRETLSYPVFAAKMQKIYEDVLMER